METKLLVISIGTTGGEVGLAYRKHMREHPTKDFYYETCFLDTSDSLIKSGRVSADEFVHMAVDSYVMQNILRDTEHLPEQLKLLLYSDCPPPPSTSTGAGNIRYAAAPLLTLQTIRDAIHAKLTDRINHLTNQGHKGSNISFMIVLSVIGATGSGVLHLFLPILLEVTRNAGITRPYIDLLVLHPTLRVNNPRLLANAEAFYAESAATHGDSLHKSYNGRTLVLGGSGAYAINHLPDLEKAAATLIRLTTYPNAGIMKPYQDSLPNRSILGEASAKTNRIPSHLSSATPVTISLSHLSQQIITADTARLFHKLTLGTNNTSDTDEPHTNTLLGLLNFLQGEDSNTSYDLVLDELTRYMEKDLQSFRSSETKLAQLRSVQQASTLRQNYENDKIRIQDERGNVSKQEKAVFDEIKKNIRQKRSEAIIAGSSLMQLVKDYEEVLQRIKRLQSAAAKRQITLPTAEEALNRRLDELGRRRDNLSGVIRAIRANLVSERRSIAVKMATTFLNDLQKECAEARRRLQSVIAAAQESYQEQAGWQDEQPALSPYSENPLHIPALTQPEDIAQYYNRVSMFGDSGDQQADVERTEGPMAAFRDELQKQAMVEHCFDGNYHLLFEMMQQYVETHVQKKIETYPLLKVFELLGTNTLKASLKQAFERAHPLIALTKEYAIGSVEERYVIASWNEPAQKVMLQRALQEIAPGLEPTESDDPTEIVVFYLVDGLAMPAISDLTGRCLTAYLEQRAEWHGYLRLSAEERQGTSYNPVHSGDDIDKRVTQLSIMKKVYNMRRGVEGYDQHPDLA